MVTGDHGAGAHRRRRDLEAHLGSPITPAILFVSIGLLAGPEVFDIVDISSTDSTARLLAEATLAFVLFSDASRIDLAKLRREASVPLRLLGIGLPLTIVLGALAAAVIFDVLTFWEPSSSESSWRRPTRPSGRRSSPSLGSRAVSARSERRERTERRNLRAAALRGRRRSRRESHISEGRTGLTLVVEEIGYGVLGGVVAGLLIGAIVVYGGRKDLIDGNWRQVIPAAGAALGYGIAVALGGSGFIAAFVGGMVFRAAIKRDPEDMNRLTEEVGAVLNGLTFVLFGAILLGPALGELGWQLVIYSVLSLTVVRILPVAIAMLGSKARMPTLGFLGWFGPRGLASIVFAVIIIEESQLPHENLLVLAIYLTVGLSVFAHGLTAAPMADRYAAWFERHPRDKVAPLESAPAEVTRTRGLTRSG